MALFDRLPDGEIDDRARITINGADVHIFQQYEVRCSMFSPPASFGCRIGSGETTKEITNRFQPNLPYQLRIGPVLQHSGRLDGYAPEGSQGATEVDLRGRDAMSRVMSPYVTADRSFGNATYIELVEKVLAACGLSDATIFYSNAANRLAVAGALGGTPATIKTDPAKALSSAAAGQFQAGISQAAAAATIQIAVNAEKVEGSKGKSSAKPLQAKVGQRWWDFLFKELSRAGFFLFAGSDVDTFILTQPDPNQSALYQLVRQRNAPRDENRVNVISARHQNETAGRFSHYIVHGRGGHGTHKAALAAIGGDYVDQEMVDWGFNRPWCHADPQANNDKRAGFLARRKAAEDRRQGWHLTYTVKGHTAPLLGAESSGERVIWTPDTVVKVYDDELGLYDFYWLESVAYRGSMSGTTTELTLLRAQDLVFGEPDFQ